jgi:hypothetical protein
LELIEKLAALVPVPRAHLVRYSGFLGPAAKWRSQIIPEERPSKPAASQTGAGALSKKSAERNSSPSVDGVCESPKRKRKNYSWSELIQRIFQADVMACKCGGKLRLISAIQPPAARKILDHCGLPSKPPPLARAAPDTELAFNFE